jgi:glutamine synthetase
MQGRLQGKRLHAQFFLDHVLGPWHRGLQLPAHRRCRDEHRPGYAMSSWERGYGDMFFDLDLDTLRRTPGEPNAAMIQCDLSWLDGSGEVAAVAAHHPQEATGCRGRAGLWAFCGTELEFILFEDSYDAAWDRRYIEG